LLPPFVPGFWVPTLGWFVTWYAHRRAFPVTTGCRLTTRFTPFLRLRLRYTHTVIRCRITGYVCCYTVTPPRLPTHTFVYAFAVRVLRCQTRGAVSRPDAPFVATLRFGLPVATTHRTTRTVTLQPTPGTLPRCDYAFTGLPLLAFVLRYRFTTHTFPTYRTGLPHDVAYHLNLPYVTYGRCTPALICHLLLRLRDPVCCLTQYV